MSGSRGYTLIILVVVVALLSLALTAAVPLWQTEIQREKEAELVHRGLQIVDALRRYQAKNPGRSPATLRELYEKRYLRRPFRDPMTKDGAWLVLVGGMPPTRGETLRTEGNVVRFLAVPEDRLSDIPGPRIVGVVSASPRKSFRLWNGQETYDAWSFYVGMKEGEVPEIVRFGREDKSR